MTKSTSVVPIKNMYTIKFCMRNYAFNIYLIENSSSATLEHLSRNLVSNRKLIAASFEQGICNDKLMVYR